MYFWSAGEMSKVPRKSSWKMSNGGLPGLPTVPAEEGCTKAGAKYTEAEFQQALMGLKREHKENIEKMRKDQDEALFKVRSCFSSFDCHIYSFLFLSPTIFRFYKNFLY